MSEPQTISQAAQRGAGGVTAETHSEGKRLISEKEAEGTVKTKGHVVRNVKGQVCTNKHVVCLRVTRWTFELTFIVASVTFTLSRFLIFLSAIQEVLFDYSDPNQIPYV